MSQSGGAGRIFEKKTINNVEKDNVPMTSRGGLTNYQQRGKSKCAIVSQLGGE